MEPLTKKQIQNRAYYAKNAEKIIAKKREQYFSSKTAKSPKARKTKPEPVTIKPGWQESPAKSKTSKATKEESAKLKARRRIEDILMARELGLDDADL